jgi:hypothetical protein
MNYGTPYPVTAQLEGGDFDGKTITLPAAFRGVDVENRGKIARYRYGGQTAAGHTYQFKSARRGFRPGAARLDFGDGFTGSGLHFYP